MHTLLDLRGNIPSFIHISDGKLHDVHALDMLLPEAGAIYVVRSWLRRLCPPLCVAPSRGLLRHACQVEHRCYNTERPHSALGGKTPAEAYRGAPPVDMMDKPLRALPTSPQAQQQRQGDRCKEILAA